MMRVVTLVGLMGAGKSTVARRLAKRWEHAGWRAIDLDREIERRAGQKIPALFAEVGEPAFRALEAEALRAALADEHVVVATGGGAPCAPGAMDAILAAGPAVWLDGPSEVLAARALAGGGRPLLAGLDLAGATARLEAQRAARAPHYARADLIVDTRGGAAATVRAIVAALIWRASTP